MLRFVHPVSFIPSRRLLQPAVARGAEALVQPEVGVCDAAEQLAEIRNGGVHPTIFQPSTTMIIAAFR